MTEYRSTYNPGEEIESAGESRPACPVPGEEHPACSNAGALRQALQWSLVLPGMMRWFWDGPRRRRAGPERASLGHRIKCPLVQLLCPPGRTAIAGDCPPTGWRDPRQEEPAARTLPEGPRSPVTSQLSARTPWGSAVHVPVSPRCEALAASGCVSDEPQSNCRAPACAPPTPEPPDPQCPGGTHHTDSPLSPLPL